MRKLILLGMLIGFSLQLSAQTPQEVITTTDTLSFKVSGLCGMCKARIENAALIKGVKTAEWNKETKLLTLIVNPQKVNLEDIHNSIAKAGHDTSLKKGDDKTYAKLPSCCKYRDKTLTSH